MFKSTSKENKINMPYKEYETDKKPIHTYWDKVKIAIKCIILTPIAYLFNILIVILAIGVFSFIIWFMSLVIRALLKYLGE